MKCFTPKPHVLAAALSFVVLGAGCAGPTTNTQRGAAGGAALGALAGAIIGNNRGSGNAASGAAIGAATGAIAGGMIGRSRDVRESQAAGSGYTPETQATTGIVVSGTPPMAPAPMVETKTARPNSGAVWVDGYWSYENGSNYVWVPGRWEMPPQGYSTFQPPHWTRQGNNQVYVRGYWR